MRGPGIVARAHAGAVELEHVARAKAGSGLAPRLERAGERDDAFLNLLSWIPRADLIAVYVDYGITPAMQVAINVAITKNKKIEYRSVGEV